MQRHKFLGEAAEAPEIILIILLISNAHVRQLDTQTHNITKSLNYNAALNEQGFVFKDVFAIEAISNQATGRDMLIYM